jgi:hypothetical protein
MVKKILSVWILILCGMSCIRNSAIGPKETRGTVQGTVKSAGIAFIHPAYLFCRDSLLATTDEQGKYTIASMNEGPAALTCSALNYRDTTVQVQVKGGQTIAADFMLTPDSTIGKVYGEFQDWNLFNDSLITNPSLANWDAKRIFDAATGATIQYKTLGYEVGERRVYLGDSLLAVSDAWGQFWFKIPCGTRPIKGSCEGYYDAAQVVKVLPNTHHYVNFFLIRINPDK